MNEEDRSKIAQAVVDKLIAERLPCGVHETRIKTLESNVKWLRNTIVGVVVIGAAVRYVFFAG